MSRVTFINVIFVTLRIKMQVKQPFLCDTGGYHKDTEPLYHSLMYSVVSLLSSIYPLPVL